MDTDILAIGFKRGEHIHLAVNEAGQGKIPIHCIISKKNYATNMYDVILPATKFNVGVLLLCGYITHNDAKKILNKA